MTSECPPRPSFAPRHWPGWLAVAALWVLAWLPRRVGLLLVAPLAPLAYRLGHRRRAIAERNIERCFPDWPPDRRREVVRESFTAVTRMVAELAWCWSGPQSRFARCSRVEGLDHLLSAEEEGNGVLVITGHFPCMEIGARIGAAHTRFAGGVYRPLNNPVLEWYQTRGRLNYTDFMVSKRDARQAVRYLRKGAVLWYAPDQDFGPEQSVFAPFFDIPAATLLATHRLARMTGCAVVPMFPSYDRATRTYTVEIMPPLEDFPDDDPAENLARINAIIESQVRKRPGQYWWIHRRFKTRPEGEPPFYD